MTARIERMLNYVLTKEHYQYRQRISDETLDTFTQSLMDRNLPDIERAKERLTWVLEHEIPVILPDERIVFTKTVTRIPEIFTPEEWSELRANHYIHEMGRVCNINPDYSTTIDLGLDQRKIEILQSIEDQKSKGNDAGVKYLQVMLKSIEDVLKLVDRYALKAMESGREDIYDLLKKVPRKGATNLLEALQSFRILHFTLWASGN
jgi:hypothetical protein